MTAILHPAQVNHGEERGHEGSTISGSADNGPSGMGGLSVSMEPAEIREDVSGPLVQWNKPRINFYRYLAALYSFLTMGMNDAAYGVSRMRTF